MFQTEGFILTINDSDKTQLVTPAAFYDLNAETFRVMSLAITCVTHIPSSHGFHRSPYCDDAHEYKAVPENVMLILQNTFTTIDKVFDIISQINAKYGKVLCAYAMHTADMISERVIIEFESTSLETNCAAVFWNNLSENGSAMLQITRNSNELETIAVYVHYDTFYAILKTGVAFPYGTRQTQLKNPIFTPTTTPAPTRTIVPGAPKKQPTQQMQIQQMQQQTCNRRLFQEYDQYDEEDQQYPQYQDQQYQDQNDDYLRCSPRSISSKQQINSYKKKLTKTRKYVKQFQADMNYQIESNQQNLQRLQHDVEYLDARMNYQENPYAFNVRVNRVIQQQQQQQQQQHQQAHDADAAAATEEQCQSKKATPNPEVQKVKEKLERTKIRTRRIERVQTNMINSINMMFEDLRREMYEIRQTVRQHNKKLLVHDQRLRVIEKHIFEDEYQANHEAFARFRELEQRLNAQTLVQAQAQAQANEELDYEFEVDSDHGFYDYTSTTSQIYNDDCDIDCDCSELEYGKETRSKVINSINQLLDDYGNDQEEEGMEWQEENHDEVQADQGQEDEDDDVYGRRFSESD